MANFKQEFLSMRRSFVNDEFKDMGTKSLQKKGVKGLATKVRPYTLDQMFEL